MKDAIQFVKSCYLCQIKKINTGKHAGLLNPIKEIIGQLLQRITIDFLEPLPKYTLIAACNTTKYVIAKAVPKKCKCWLRRTVLIYFHSDLGSTKKIMLR